MQRYIVEHIIRVYHVKLAALAVQLKDDYNKTIIHHFRVDTKKLRAFYRLLSLEAGQNGQLELPRKLKQMYRCAGAARDIQLQVNGVADYTQNKDAGLQALQSLLEQRLGRLDRKNKHILSKPWFQRQERKALERAPLQLGAETLQLFFRQKKEAITAIITRGQFSIADLHDTRKNIKDVLYVTGIYTEEIHSSLPLLFWKNDDLKEMEDLAHELGLYNDINNTLSLLKNASIRFTGKSLQNTLAYYRYLEEEKKALHDKLVARLSNLPLLFSPGTPRMHPVNDP